MACALQVIELPIKHPELFESLGVAQPKVNTSFSTVWSSDCQVGHLSWLSMQSKAACLVWRSHSKPSDGLHAKPAMLCLESLTWLALQGCIVAVSNTNVGHVPSCLANHSLTMSCCNSNKQACSQCTTSPSDYCNGITTCNSALVPVRAGITVCR